jgi:hypothetical protein
MILLACYNIISSFLCTRLHLFDHGPNVNTDNLKILLLVHVSTITSKSPQKKIQVEASTILQWGACGGTPLCIVVTEGEYQLVALISSLLLGLACPGLA